MHKLYVLSILRHIQHHTGEKLVYRIAKKQSFFSPLHRSSGTIQSEDMLVNVVETVCSEYLSLIQLTNLLACANHQLSSDTLV